MSDSNIWVQVWATKGRKCEETASFKQVELLQFFSSYVRSFMAIVSSCLKDCSSRSTAKVPNSLMRSSTKSKHYFLKQMWDYIIVYDMYERWKTYFEYSLSSSDVSSTTSLFLASYPMDRQSLHATSAFAMFSSPCCQKKSAIFCLFISTAHTSSSLKG